MKIKYIYSACIVIETADCRICCDPWFTQGIYDGSWYQYPHLENPVESIGKIDFVYVSHIHPDHYDPQFLRLLLTANPQCVLVVGVENQGFLTAKMRRDGFEPVSVSRLSVGETQLQIFPNFASGEVNIDSALAVRSNELTVVNLNDCPFDYLQIEMIKEFCGGSPDLACLPYAGAGPYPQMYQFKSSEEYLVAAEKKKQQFLAQFGRYLSELKPHYAMPFAGLYYLGGALRSRNRFRGIPDALEVQEIFGDSVVVLEEEFGEIDLVKGEWSHPRTKRYEDEDRDKYLSKFDLVPYHYESDAQVELEELKKLLQMAHNNAVSRIQSVPNRWICFQVKMSEYLCVHSEYPGVVESRNAVDDLAEREVISIDGRLLHGLLTRKFHWNNAEIGSHFSFFRSPETYDRRVYDLLNFLHV